MKYCDFLSVPPSLYLLKEKKGKNKLGGFFSIIFILIMLAVTVYYFYIYFSGIKYNLKYIRDNWTSSFTEEEKDSINKNIEFYLSIEKNDNNASIIPILFNDNGNYDYNVPKCNENYEIEPNGIIFCFNISFYHLNNSGFISLYLICKENCRNTDGYPANIEISLTTKNLKIEHGKNNPLSFEGEYGDIFQLPIAGKSYIHSFFQFTPIIYKTTKILSTKSDKFINIYFSDHLLRTYVDEYENSAFWGFNTIISTDNELYEREYITLLDTLSAIGGLFTTFKMIFSMLIMFFSDVENNFQITKNIIIKKHMYQNSGKKILLYLIKN